MNMPTSGQVAAFGRHAATAAGTLVATLAVLHLTSADDAAKANSAFSQIGDGVTKIVAGVGALIPIVSGVYASLTASPLWQMLSLVKNPSVKAIVTDPSTAAAVPSDKVVPSVSAAKGA